MKTLDRIQPRPYVEHVDDERALDNGVIVTLKPGYIFTADPGCGVRGFDTLSEALSGTARDAVQQSASASRSST